MKLLPQRCLPAALICFGAASLALAGLKVTGLAAEVRASGDAAGATPSVLVHTVMPRTGSMNEIVTGYGEASYDPGGLAMLSRQQEGRVLAVSVTPGQPVRAGQELIAFAASAQAVSGFRQAQTAFSLALAQRAHARQMLAQRLATRDQVAQADKTLADAQSSLEALRQEGGGASVQTLTAPFDGVVQALPVIAGDRVAPGASLVTLARADAVVASVGIEPASRGRVHPGQAASIQPLQPERPVFGQVLRVAGQIDPHSRLVMVDIRLSGPTILAGEAVRADIAVGLLGGWLVPRGAVVEDNERLALFQVRNGHALQVPVAVRAEQGDQDLVVGTIDPALPVVVEGAYQLRDNAAVRGPS